MTALQFEFQPERRQRDRRYDLLSAIDHLLEGSELYARAAQAAARRGDAALQEFFGNLERTSRRQVELARELLGHSEVPLPPPVLEAARQIVPES